MKRKRYSRKFQRMAVERMRSSDNIGDLAKLAGATGLEPATSCVTGRRSNQLNYPL